MEKEKKGLFGRLLDFWREKSETGTTDGIGFRDDAVDVEKHFAEMGAVASLTQEETKKVFWEKMEVEQGNPVLEKQKQIFMAEEDLDGQQKNLFLTEESERLLCLLRLFFHRGYLLGLGIPVGEGGIGLYA